MVIIVSHVQAHFSHLPAAACRGRSDQSKVDKDAGKNTARDITGALLVYTDIRLLQVVLRF